MKALLAAALMLPGVATAGQRLGEPQPVRAPEKVYAVTCGYCHGGNVGPVIQGRGLDRALVTMIVRHGQNAMPAFRPTEISDAELAALADWVRASKPDSGEQGR